MKQQSWVGICFLWWKGKGTDFHCCYFPGVNTPTMARFKWKHAMKCRVGETGNKRFSCEQVRATPTTPTAPLKARIFLQGHETTNSPCHGDPFQNTSPDAVLLKSPSFYNTIFFEFVFSILIAVSNSLFWLIQQSCLFLTAPNDLEML